jgi:hypothetical protein
MVEAMAGYGVPEAHIARTLSDRGIDPKTLRRHFRKELDTGATKANAAVAQSLFKMASSGNHPAASMFWLKCRAGWRETTILEHTGPQGGPLEILHGTLNQRITDELARVAATPQLAEVPGAADEGGEGGSAVSVARLEGATEPTGAGG